MGVSDPRSASGAGASASMPPRSYAQMIVDEGKTEPAVSDASSAGPSLRLGTQLAYSFLRLPLSALDFTFRPARTAIWVDTLGQSLSSQASLISAVKSVDLLLGFSVGKASDNLRSRYGRRKPFILFLFPVSLLAFLGFVNAASLGLARPGSGGEQPCASLVLNATGANGCPALRACLDAAIAAGRLDTHDRTTPALAPKPRIDAPIVNTAFALLYFVFLACCATGSTIPYDALGMELSTDYHDRSSLFGIKTLFSFAGFAAAPAVGLGLATAYGGDLVALYLVQSFAFAALGMLAYAVLLQCVEERPPPPAAHAAVPFIPSARRVLANHPYRLYLWVRLPLSLFALMPSNLASLWVKHNMALEGWVGIYNYILVWSLLGGMAAIGVLVKAAHRYGKRRVLVRMLLVTGLVYIGVALLPASYFRAHPSALVPIGMLVGIGQVLGFVLPDAMLADIIDYAELHSGTRDEGMYTVIETNLMQFIDIAGGTLPMLFLAGAGYAPLGGCTCGCGVSCGRALGQPYARWHCPDNVGYSCTGGFGSALLYAPEPAVAPCAAQGEAVQGLISLFFLAVPGVLALVAAVPASRYPITAPAHAAIRAAVAARAASPGVTVYDPLDGSPVLLPPNTPATLVKEHFSRQEWELAARTGRLRALLCSRLALWLVLAGGLLAAMLYSGEAVLTLGFLALSVLFILIPWDAMRLYVFYTSIAGTAASPAPSTPSTGVELATTSWAHSIGQPAVDVQRVTS